MSASEMALKERMQRLVHVPALDGLRALAVLAVLFYHAGLTWTPGGFLGVVVFFVISGYLITSLLLAEWSACGRVDLKLFWLRRARRLLPALFLFILCVVAFSVVFMPSEVAGLRGDVLSAVVYVNNWYQMVDHKSYFETIGRPSLFRHLWSLAIEEQFYLVWPVVFSLLMWLRKPGLALGVVLGGICVSAAWMAALYQPDIDPSRVYYGTDTRVGEILAGAALALILRPGQSVGRMGRWIPEAAGLGAIAVLSASVMLVNVFNAFLYFGGLTLIGLTTAVLIAVVVRPQSSIVQRVLSIAPLRWAGLRSYGIYLWHFPVFMLTRPEFDVPIAGAPLLLAQFALTALLAEGSYRFIETPIRRGAIGHCWDAWREARGSRKRILGLLLVVDSASVAIIFFVFGWLLVNAQPPPEPEYLSIVPIPARPALENSAFVSQTNQAPVSPGISTTPVQNSVPVSGAGEEQCVTVIGDSVLEGVGDELKRALRGSVIMDAEKGRLPWKTPAVVRKLHVENRIRPAVVIHIGDNGVFTAGVFDKIMAELKEARKIVVVNVRVPRNWETPNNEMLAEAVKRHPNTVLLDWHSASDAHPEFFWKDGFHLRPAGAQFFAELIAKALVTEQTPPNELAGATLASGCASSSQQ